MGLEVCVAHLADSLEPPPRQTVSEWADQNRRLSWEASAERGEWRTDRGPYQRAIRDGRSPDSPYEGIVVMSSSQIGKTEILNNFAGYIIDRDPGPLLVVQPRVQDGKEGDPVSLTTKRTATFWNRKIVMFSPPTAKGAWRIEALDYRLWAFAALQALIARSCHWRRRLSGCPRRSSESTGRMDYGCKLAGPFAMVTSSPSGPKRARYMSEDPALENGPAPAMLSVPKKRPTAITFPPPSG